MGYSTSIIADNSISGITYTYLELQGKFLTGVGVAEYGTGVDALDFRAVVFVTAGGREQAHIVCGLCEGMIGPGLIIGWSGRIPIYDNMHAVCYTRGNTSDNAYFGCITEE